MKNNKSIGGVFGYIFIVIWKIVGGLGNKSPVITNKVSFEIDLTKEIHARLLSQGLRKIEKFGFRMGDRSVRQNLLM